MKSDMINCQTCTRVDVFVTSGIEQTTNTLMEWADWWNEEGIYNLKENFHQTTCVMRYALCVTNATRTKLRSTIVLHSQIHDNYYTLTLLLNQWLWVPRAQRMCICSPGITHLQKTPPPLISQNLIHTMYTSLWLKLINFSYLWTHKGLLKYVYRFNVHFHYK